MKKYNWDKELLIKAINKSDSYSETLKNLNIPKSGNNIKTLKGKITLYNLDISHFTFKKYHKTKMKLVYKPYSYYIENNIYITTGSLKVKLLKEGIKENKCEICGITSWNNLPINCQLHHIDGNNKNNKLDNLQMLCPNCHSQTENYCGGANKKKHYYCKLCNKEIGRKSTYCPQCNTFLQRKIKDRPTREELIELFKQYKSFSKIGKLFNISDNGIKKWYKFENLPYKIKDMNEFLLNNV